MKRASLAAVSVAALLGAGALATYASGEPTPGGTPTVWRTVTERATYHGYTAKRAVQQNQSLRVRLRAASRDGRLRARTIRAQRVALRRRWAPTVSYAYSLAAAATGVPRSELARVGWCESTDIPTNSNGDGVHIGLFALSWDPLGFPRTDPVASALSAALTRVHDGSWRQWAASRACSGLR